MPVGFRPNSIVGSRKLSIGALRALFMLGRVFLESSRQEWQSDLHTILWAEPGGVARNLWVSLLGTQMPEPGCLAGPGTPAGCDKVAADCDLIPASWPSIQIIGRI